MEFNRAFEMPNKNTFKLISSQVLIERYINDNDLILDPFANECNIKSLLSKHNVKYISNDLNPKYECDYNLEGYEFLKQFDTNSVDVILYDPPYSPRQLKECYDDVGISLTQQDTQNSTWTRYKKEITRILKVNGICISWGWNSNGIGINNGFDKKELWLVAHGGNHNDTIILVEKKNKHQEKLELGSD